MKQLTFSAKFKYETLIRLHDIPLSKHSILHFLPFGIFKIVFFGSASSMQNSWICYLKLSFTDM